MNRRFFLLLFLFFLQPSFLFSLEPGQSDSLTANQKDSLIFAEAPWETKIIHFGGIMLRQYAFSDSSLFNSNQTISVLTVRNNFRFDIVADTTLVLTKDFVEFAQALAGINGSFFAWDAPWKSVNYLRVNGSELAPNRLNEKGLRSFHQSGCLVVSAKGRVSIHKVPDTLMTRGETNDWEKTLTGEDVLSSGPVLRIQGKDEMLLDNSFNLTRHPRTAIGIRKGGWVVLVVVDGRAEEAAGMTMEELQHIMRWLKSWDAINLDGGGSSTMCVRKNLRQPVQTVNHPSDNRLFDHQGDRKVANALIVQ
ncbi:MAG TPA: phosphodiester glycosidase family protein [Bacteroidales bacterium]|nr:phosphodiester glycosidase family protein [Bacteroidales bacterium]